MRPVLIITLALGVAVLGTVIATTTCSRGEPAPLSVSPQQEDSEIPPKARSATTADVLEFLGPTLATIVTNPDRVLIYQIEKKPNPEDPRKKIVGYPIKQEGGEVDATKRSRWSDYCTSPFGFYSLDQQLRNPDPNQGSMVAPCLFTPGYAVEFIKGDAKCFVLICFTCSEWKFLDSQGRILRNEHFFYQSPRIRGLAEACFPDKSPPKPDPRLDRPPRATAEQPIP